MRRLRLTLWPTGIKDIPDHKEIGIHYGFTVSGNAPKDAGVGPVLQSLLNVPHHAKGTANWRGGPTWINEDGGEIVDLPSGSRIIPADKSAAMMAGGMDYERLADAVARAVAKRPNVLDGKVMARSLDQRLAPR